MRTKRIVGYAGTLACAAALLSGAAIFVGTAQAQDGPPGGGADFNPQQFRQAMMERLRDQLEIKSDDEWKVIQERIEKVMEARRALGGFGMGGIGMGGPGMMPPPDGGPGGNGGLGGPGGPGDGPPDANGNPGNPGGDSAGPGGPPAGGPMRASSPEAEALRTAVRANASTEVIQSKLAKLREVRKANEAKLAQAQENLRKVLTVKQEAIAVLNGLLD